MLLEEKTVQRLKQAFAEVIKLEAGRVDAEEPLESYGIDSIMITQLNQKLGVVFEGLSKTLFFEHRSLAALAGHLARDYAPACVAWTGLVGNEEASAAPAISLASAPVTGGLRKQQRLGWRMGRAEREPIAIIGLSGRYAQAETLGEYWENLKQGRDCIGEIPPERWALDGFYLPDADAAVAQGKSYSKWGGFLDGADRFDPLFFNISPREAEGMDPQERLFLQACWEVLEDAGYTRRHLVERHGGRSGSLPASPRRDLSFTALICGGRASRFRCTLRSARWQTGSRICSICAGQACRSTRCARPL